MAINLRHQIDWYSFDKVSTKLVMHNWGNGES